MKDELVKDLLNILTKEVIRCGDSIETRKTEAYFLANRLSDLGYVKVVLCRDCWKWGTDDCPVGDSWDDSDFCCYGEAKEGEGSNA